MEAFLTSAEDNVKVKQAADFAFQAAYSKEIYQVKSLRKASPLYRVVQLCTLCEMPGEFHVTIQHFYRSVNRKNL